ncbi:RNA polymerase sigma factor [Tundrisphaera lichenicola]|uniref:RNA polymerase sigma factor n=1 Tax=Tundrisphaera lichenicola TaxID=2029860 RepID=UPI003EB9F6A9
MPVQDRDGDRSPGDSFPDLMALVQAGDEGATREVHDRCSDRLIRLAKARLGHSIAGKEDPEDVVQSVYRSFFRRFGEGSFQVEDWSAVWALLAKIAGHKCSNRRKYYLANRRDSRLEKTMDSCDLASPEPNAEQAVMLSETVERLLGDLDEPDRSIVLLSLQGYSTVEIASIVSRSERTVQRVREWVRLQLERWNDRQESRTSL